MSLAAAIVSVIENLVGSFSFSQRCSELLSVGASETWPFSALLPFDPSRHELLALYWATEEGFELSLPLSDLSEQCSYWYHSRLSLILSWIKRKRTQREPLQLSEYLRDGSSPWRGRKKEVSDLILELNSKLIAVLITRHHYGNISHFSPQQRHYLLILAFNENNISVT